MTKHTTAKNPLFIASAVVLSLLLLTITSCDIKEQYDGYFGDYEDEAMSEQELRWLRTHVAATAAWPDEEATLIAEVATYEAKATGTAEAEAITASNEEQLVDELVSEEAAASVEQQAAEEPAPVEGCDAPGEQCVLEARFDFGVTFEEYDWQRNEVNISFPADGGDVTGNFHFERMMEARWEDRYCLEVHRYHGTLSGHYDPVSRKLKGPVHGPSTSWEELEGCEYHETESIGGDATSWYATYDPITGELQGIVEWETEDPEDVEWPFHN